MLLDYILHRNWLKIQLKWKDLKFKIQPLKLQEIILNLLSKILKSHNWFVTEQPPPPPQKQKTKNQNINFVEMLNNSDTYVT